MQLSKFAQSVANYMENALQKTFPTIEPTFPIFVKDLQGKSITINDVKSSDIVQTVLDKAEDKTGVPAKEMRLIYAGKQLDINLTLADYKITKDANLHLVGRLRGAVGERIALQQSIQDNITHGNVVGALTKESVIATEATRVAIRLMNIRQSNKESEAHIRRLDTLIIQQTSKIKGLYDAIKRNSNNSNELQERLSEAKEEFATLIESMVDDMELPKFYQQILSAIYNIQTSANSVPINPVYNEKPKLVALYQQSLISRGLNAGNCDEMAINTALHLIESTRNQWVYRCAIHGTFDTNMPADAPHNQMGHVFVVTTYTNYGQHLPMNAPDATVVDSWYNNLVCSLEDYMLRLHPYYNYNNVFPNGRTLAPNEIKVLDCWEAVGVSFAVSPTDESQLSEANAISKIKSKKKLIYGSVNVDLDAVNKDADFQFSVDNTVVRDARDTASLELLLLNAENAGSTLMEVSSFTMTSFVKVLKTTNLQVFSILYKALDNVENDIFLHFLNAATSEQWQAYYNDSPERQQGILNRQLSHTLIDEWLSSLEDGLLNTNKSLDIWELD